MSYHKALHGLAAASEKRVLAALNAYQAGALSADEFVRVVANIIAAANSRAAALADYSLASTLIRETGDVHATVGLLAGDPERLEKGARTLLAALVDGEDIRERLTRFASSEPMDTAQMAYQRGIAGTKIAKGWRRRLSAEACELCTWWWREGRVWPKDHYFQSHKGCTCTPEPVVGRVRETEYTRTGKRSDNRHREGWNDGNTNRAPRP